MAKTKEKKQVVKKVEKKLNDPRSDPIPKPPMFPAPRPPRDQIPQRTVPNSSLGVRNALNDGSSSRGDSVLGVSPLLVLISRTTFYGDCFKKLEHFSNKLKCFLDNKML